MGLSGRKVKQRIGNDPRNLSWADDASRFGQSYLEKFGWDTSKGLGASGEGRTNAIKMSQKLDMLGIGMQQNQNDPNGIAWRQNRDFENLLQRLNNGTEAIGPFHKARGSSPSEVQEVAAEAVDSAHDDDEGANATKLEKKKKKRKALQEDSEESARDKRERKKRKKSRSNVAPADDGSPSLETQAAAAATTTSESTPVPIAPIAAPSPIRALPRAHRARIIAAKRMAASNSAALAEILGIPSSSSSTAATAPASPSPLTNATAVTTPGTTPTAVSDAQEEDPLQKLTTASQSVGDYFRAKLGAKASAQPRSKHLSAPPPVTRDEDEDDDAPRSGLGAARLVLTGRLNEPVFAMSKFAAMFARGQDTADAKEEIADGDSVERAETQDDVADEEERGRSARRRAKEERRREKEERRRKKEAKSKAIAEPVAEPPNSALVLELSVGEVQPGHTRMRKHRELGLLEDNLAPSDGGTVAVQNKKQKKRDKGRKTGKDTNP